MSEEQLEQTEVQVEDNDAAYFSENENGLDFFEKNKKVIIGVLAAILIVVVGSYIYKYQIVMPKHAKSQESLWHAEHSLLNQENWVAAINGDSLGHKGLKKVAEEFSGYSGGRIAQYDLGIAYLNNAQYNEAIEALKLVDFDDEMVSTVALGAIGDAYMELGNLTDAVSYYEQAYKNSKNELTAPIYMIKAASGKELDSKFDDAVKIYTDLINQYPNSELVENAKKNIELAKVGKSIHNL